MAVSGKYGKVFISKIGEEEPIFILRAQDQLALQAIEMYRDLVAKNGLILAESLQKEIDTFRNWSGPKRLPD
jgi:predicted regulator of Ras-like GTPase activity (Roadblock/LC7/MglB family)